MPGSVALIVCVASCGRTRISHSNRVSAAERAGVGVALGGRQELVRAREIAVFDQLLGQINADPGAERLVRWRKLERTVEEVPRGRDVGSLAGAPTGRVQVSAGAPGERRVDPRPSSWR